MLSDRSSATGVFEMDFFRCKKRNAYENPVCIMKALDGVDSVKFVPANFNQINHKLN